MAKRKPEPPRQKTSAEKLVQDAEVLESMAGLAPFFRLFGERGAELADTLEEHKGIAAKARELKGLPARFNRVLQPHGWIAYERMNQEVLKQATELAEANDIAGAENILIESFDPKTLTYHIMWMSHVKAFKPRVHLTRLAATDYEAGRYHASVPVVLAQLDGLIADLVGDALFHKTKQVAPKLLAWDSISATEGGLPALAELMAQPRYETTTDPLDVPYRHGILHGRDLGYANKKVAAKAWAALFALREWALKFEKGELEAPPVEPPPSLLQVLTQLAKTVEQNKAIEAWQPREPFVPADDSAVKSDTPEAAVLSALRAWLIGGVGTYQPWSAEGDVKGFALREVRDTAAAETEVTILATFGDGRVRSYRAVAIYVDAEGSFLLRGTAGGTWRVRFRRLQAFEDERRVRA